MLPIGGSRAGYCNAAYCQRGCGALAKKRFVFGAGPAIMPTTDD
jgi:hypothetical protein